MIRRREFITLLGSAAAWPLAARGQQPKRLGVLMNGAPRTGQANVAAFTEQLRKLGWLEGRNIQTEYRWNEGEAALARTYAAELLRLGLDAILVSTTFNLTALQRLSPSAPIVFIQVSDPVTQGFVVEMAHPGGNITGFSYYEFTIGGKWVDLLKQLVPTLAQVGVMFNPETTPQSKFFMDSIEAAAQRFGITVVALPVAHVAEIEPAIADFSRQPKGGLLFPPGARSPNLKLIIDAVNRNRIPAIYASSGRDFSRAGGLMEYGPNVIDQYRQAGLYVDRILKGTRAGDLPVQAPTKFSLSINLKAARDLGIEVPLSLLLIADEQIE